MNISSKTFRPEKGAIDVLVVDDEEDIRAVLQDGLAACGMSVRTADSGKAAVLESLRQTPAVVLMDVLMPNLSGLDALGLFKIIEPLRNIPVLMLTALKGREDVVSAMRAGSRDYISKPFDLKDTAERLRRVLSQPLPPPFPIFRSLTYTASSDGRGIRLELEDEFTTSTAEDLWVLVRALAPILPLRIDLDFEKVSGIGDGLLSSLMTIRETAEKAGGEICIRRLDEKKYGASAAGALRRVFPVEEAPVEKKKPFPANRPREVSDRDKEILSELTDRMSGLRVEAKPAEDHMWLEFRGDITADTRAKVAEAFASLSETWTPVVVRLDGITNLDDLGMAHLIKTISEFKRKTNMNVVVIAENPVIEKSFTAARGHRVAGFYKEKVKALAAIRSSV